MPLELRFLILLNERRKSTTAEVEKSLLGVSAKPGPRTKPSASRKAEKQMTVGLGGLR